MSGEVGRNSKKEFDTAASSRSSRSSRRLKLEDSGGRYRAATAPAGRPCASAQGRWLLYPLCASNSESCAAVLSHSTTPPHLLDAGSDNLLAAKRPPPRRAPDVDQHTHQ